MQPDLRGKVAIVTGGGSGIGKACAQALAAHGADVLISGRTAGKLEAAAAELGTALATETPTPGRIVPFTADVQDAAQVAAMVEAAVSRLGRLDVLVNNAGVSARGTIEELSEEAFDRCLAINLKGAFLCAQAAWPHLRASGAGYVFNVASYAGTRGMAGSGAYCASKFALRGLSQTMSEEGKAVGIRACALCPGWVDTPMAAGASVAAADMIRPEDLAQVMLGLLGLSPVALVQEVVVHRTTG